MYVKFIVGFYGYSEYKMFPDRASRTLSHKHKSYISIYTTFPAFLASLTVIFHPLINLNMDSKAIKCWQDFWFNPSHLPWLWVRAWCWHHMQKNFSGTNWSNTWKVLGAAGRHGMENDKTGCPSSFPLNTGLSQFYSQRETFFSPSFE